MEMQFVVDRAVLLGSQIGERPAKLIEASQVGDRGKIEIRVPKSDPLYSVLDLQSELTITVDGDAPPTGEDEEPAVPKGKRQKPKGEED